MSETNEQEILNNVIRTFVRDQQISGHIQSTYHARKLITLGWNAAMQHARAEQGEVPKTNADTQNGLQNAELLPCPFCGGKAIYWLDKSVPLSHNCGFVRCRSCHNQTQSLIRQNAVEMWNRRTGEHLTDADEPQPDHFPEVTKMVQPEREGK